MEKTVCRLWKTLKTRGISFCLICERPVYVQVAPAELEALLMTHSAVHDAAVISKPDERLGELPTAFVVLRPQHSATPEELQQFVAGKLSLYISSSLNVCGLSLIHI